jgi:hypothetical protein
MRAGLWVMAIAMLMQSACNPAQSASEQDANAVSAAPEPVDDATLFQAAGFQRAGDHWSKCGDEGTLSYEPGAILQQGDFNEDGQPDAIITEGSTFCFGMTGTGYTLISQQADGSWNILSEGAGIPRLLKTRGADNWPDIEIGGPGFCFPIHRWNGREYDLNRMEYEGQPCQPEP